MDHRTCRSVTPKAGELPSARELKGVMTFRTGLRDKCPRKGITRRFSLVPSEGFDVLRAKIVNMLKDKEFGANPKLQESGAVFFKASKNARQADFKPVSSENLWRLLKTRWACLTGADIAVLTKNGGNVESTFEFEFFAYLVPPPKPKATLRRATIQRISAATEAIVAMQEERGIQLGPIAAHHIAVHHARQPENTPLVIPDDNATRQARALDQAIQELPRSTNAESDESEIEVQIFGVWVKMSVRVSSLRAALRLPQHDIFTRGIFHEFTPQITQPAGEDMPDVDHTEFDLPCE